MVLSDRRSDSDKPEGEDGERVLKPFAHALSRARMCGLQAPGEILQEPGSTVPSTEIQVPGMTFAVTAPWERGKL